MAAVGSTQTVLKVIAALDKVGIPYMLVGSYSSNFYGRPRSTKDADFVVQVSDFPVSRFRDAIGPEFVIDPQMSFETITSTMRWIAMHPASAFKIELFQLSDDAFDLTRFARRIVVEMEGHRTVMPSPEDVVVMKLRWGRTGRRTKDIDDVREVLVGQRGRLDLAYIRQWCDQHGSRALFEQLLQEATGTAPPT